MNRFLLPGAALMSLVPGAAGAAPPPIGPFPENPRTPNAAPTGSTGLGPGGAVGGIGGPYTFTAPFTGTLIMKVQPQVESTAGDVYQAFVDGKSLGFTPGVPLFGTMFSVGTFTTPVSAGPNTFDVNDQILSYIGFPSPYGSAQTFNTVFASFNPNALLVTLSEELPAAVPEPRSLATFALALVAFCCFWRRRKAE